MINVSDLQSSGVFSANSVTPGLISSGASGDILTVAGVSGKRIMLSYLIAQTGTEADITVTFGTRDVVSGLGLDDGSAAPTSLGGAFVIAPNTSGGSNVEALIGLPGEGLTVTKDTGSTVSNIYYTYMIEA